MYAHLWVSFRVRYDRGDRRIDLYVARIRDTSRGRDTHVQASDGVPARPINNSLQGVNLGTVDRILWTVHTHSNA